MKRAGARARAMGGTSMLMVLNMANILHLLQTRDGPSGECQGSCRLKFMRPGWSPDAWVVPFLAGN